MDNTLVSARVPRAKKERGSSILSAMGLTVSDLINDAFDYVISEKRLPGASEGESSPERTPQKFQAFVEECTLDIDWASQEGVDYKELIKRGRRTD
ncbi:MAG: type II toxin-antitoxin system RelB/DinJ family antitoxin [Eggerthellaceae bacterium]|nr:type II toxin-antitoxin system RelB/DinJ family antitoxin [Eggerthellaceae bacterium]